MNEIIISIIENIGYLGVFFLITLENIFPPIPSEIILLFSGFMTTFSSLNLFMVILVSTLASYTGALILYFVGRMLNENRIKKMINGNLGRMLKLEENDFDRANDWFNKKGSVTVFICRFIPLVRSLISIPAGINKMNIIKFSFYTIVATFIWNSVLSFLGVKVGENWANIAIVFDKYSFIVLIFLFIIFVIGIYIYYKKRIKKKYKST